MLDFVVPREIPTKVTKVGLVTYFACVFTLYFFIPLSCLTNFLLAHHFILVLKKLATFYFNDSIIYEFKMNLVNYFIFIFSFCLNFKILSHLCFNFE